MINFNSDKLIIVCFPAGAGGKFLINSLGLSNSCVFQNANLARQQINTNFTSKDKLEYLLTKLNSISDRWNDLDLHSPYLFGVRATDHTDKTSETINYNSIIEKIADLNQHYFFITSHGIEWVTACLNIWPNAKVILFENYEEFICKRNIETIPNTIKMIDNWIQIRGSDWPTNAPLTFKEFQNLPIHIQNEASDLHYDNFFKISNNILEKFVKFNNDSAEFKKTHSTIAWDCEWYKSPESTVNQLHNLYITLGLDDFNADAVIAYYNSWILKLNVPYRPVEVNNNFRL